MPGKTQNQKTPFFQNLQEAKNTKKTVKKIKTSQKQRNTPPKRKKRNPKKRGSKRNKKKNASFVNYE